MAPESGVVQPEPVARARPEIGDDVTRPRVPADARGLRGEEGTREQERDTGGDGRVCELRHARPRLHEHDNGDDREREQQEVRVVLAREERHRDPNTDDRGRLPVRVAEVPEQGVQPEQHREHHHELQHTEFLRDERQRHHQRAAERRRHEPDPDAVEETGCGDTVQRERAEQDQGIGNSRGNPEPCEAVENRAGQRLRIGKRERTPRRREDRRVPIAAAERAEAARVPLQRPQVEARDRRDRFRADGQLTAHPPDERPGDRDGERAQPDRAPEVRTQGLKTTTPGETARRRTRHHPPRGRSPR